ncbi:MAG: HAD hydrolase-like protein [bacterium]|nr:HAD hydrolase-like protein [bacterium]
MLYVGDHLEKDINGSRAAGWDAALHLTGSTAPQSKAVLAFTNYQDLVHLILHSQENQGT